MENAKTSSNGDDDLPPNSPSLVGKCLDMCPAKERAQRERLRDLSVFERLNGNPARTSASLAVKKFSRTLSTADIQPSDIRPLSVLEKTLKYLLILFKSSEHPFEVVHAFVFDRTRSIRQDLSMQRIFNQQAVHIYEDIVRFHVVSHQNLASCCSMSDPSSLSHLNVEQLIKCLLSLYDMYDIQRRSGLVNENEAEFYSFYVLLHLGGKIPKLGNSLSLWYSQLGFQILQSKEMRFARNLLRYSEVGNFKRFFSCIEADASDMQLCLLEPSLNVMRALAISYINYSGYKLHPYPLRHLCKVLMIKESELESLCHVCGLEISTDEAGMKSLPAKQTKFILPKSGFQSCKLATYEELSGT